MIFTTKMHSKGIEKMHYKNAFEIIIYHENALDDFFYKVALKNALGMILIFKIHGNHFYCKNALEIIFTIKMHWK